MPCCPSAPGLWALKKDLQPVQAWSVGQVIKDWSIPRLFHFLMSKTDTRKAWQELWNSLDEKSRQDYFRFNAFFSGPEPALDNTDCMDDLSRSVPLQWAEGWKRALSAFLIPRLRT
jgi:hypothetical protein